MGPPCRYPVAPYMGRLSGFPLASSAVGWIRNNGQYDVHLTDDFCQFDWVWKPPSR
jgi:hypothetical protein